MEPNRIVKMTLAETRVSLEQLAAVYGVSKQRISAKLQKELPADEQEEMRRAVIEIARDRIRRAEEIA